MSPLALVHVLLGLVAVFVGIAIVSLRKGDPRHRLLGWIYVICMLMSLLAIIVRGISHPAPFHGYAATIAAGLVTAVLMARLRGRIVTWRAWHASLMSLSIVGAAAALGGVIGGLLLGAGNGPAYYRMFNLVIIGVTLLGLWIINTRPVIWGRATGPPERAARIGYSSLVVGVSLALVLAQWALFVA